MCSDITVIRIYASRIFDHIPFSLVTRIDMGPYQPIPFDLDHIEQQAQMIHDHQHQKYHLHQVQRD